MNKDIEEQLAETALTAASSDMISKVGAGEDTKLDQVISQVIEEAVEIHNPEWKRLQEFKDRFQQIEERRTAIENELSTIDADLWIFQQRYAILVDDLNGERFNKPNIESNLEEIEEWLLNNISQQFNDITAEESNYTEVSEDIADALQDRSDLSPISASLEEASKRDEPPVRGYPERIDNLLTEFEERLDEFEVRLSSPTGWFEEFHDQLDNLEQEIDNPEGISDGLRQNVDGFIHCLDNPESASDKIKYGSSIEDFIDSVESDWESYNSELKQLSNELDKFHDQFNNFERDIDGHSEELDTIQQRLTNLENTIDNIESDLDAVEQTKDGYGTSTSVFQVRVEKLEKKIDALEEAVDSTEVRLGVSELDIEDIEDRLEKVLNTVEKEQQLEQFAAELDKFEVRLQNIRTKFDNLEEPTPEQIKDQNRVAECCQIASEGSSAYSIKPTNVEIDIKTALEVLGGSTAVAGATGVLSQAGVVLLLCGALYGEMKTEVKVEDAFVYWVGYKNRESGWQLPKNELPELVEEEKSKVDFDIQVKGEEVSEAVTRLERQGSLDVVERDDEEYIAFRETCRVEWE